MGLNITLKNYRCFDIDKPATINIGSGFTALVGPNNSGKSAFLKFFYENSSLFGQIASTLWQIQTLHSLQYNQNEIPDWEEIFSNKNEKNILITIESDHPQKIGWNALPTIKSVEVEILRKQKNFKITKLKTDAISYEGPSILEGMQNGIINGQGRSLADATLLLKELTLLNNSIYVAPFRNAITEGSGSYFGLAIGTSFIELWNSLKTGSNTARNQKIIEITKVIKKIFGFSELEINSSDDKKTLHINIDEKPYKLKNLGSGISQFIVVLANVAIRSPNYLFIDEPELNLHPSLQMDFLTSLSSYVKSGTVFTTHSIGLARSTADRIFSFKKRTTKIDVRPLEATINYSEFIGEMSFTSYKELGFEEVLLVEGVTEVKFFQQLLRMIDIEHKILLIPLGGGQFINGNHAHELEELKRITNKINVIVDSEKPSQTSPLSNERKAFIKICEELKFKTLVLERRATENYLSDSAIKSLKGEKYKSLDSYEKLSDVNPVWSKDENWKIARRMHWEELKGTDLGAFLENIKKRINRAE